MARRSEHSLDEIKEMVLNAAETIVIEEGPGALKVRKIAMEIGYTVGSIYMVFDNMADLIRHVNARTLDDIAENLNEVKDCGLPEHCIMELAKAYWAFANRHFNRWSMIFDQREGAEVDLPVWYLQKVQALFVPLETQITRLTPAIPELQTKCTARALWGGVHGVCILSLTGKLNTVGLNDVENMLILLVENFLRGLTVPAT